MIIELIVFSGVVGGILFGLWYPHLRLPDKVLHGTKHSWYNRILWIIFYKTRRRQLEEWTKKVMEEYDPDWEIHHMQEMIDEVERPKREAQQKKQQEEIENNCDHGNITEHLIIGSQNRIYTCMRCGKSEESHLVPKWINETLQPNYNPYNATWERRSVTLPPSSEDTYKDRYQIYNVEEGEVRRTYKTIELACEHIKSYRSLPNNHAFLIIKDKDIDDMGDNTPCHRVYDERNGNIIGIFKNRNDANNCLVAWKGARITTSNPQYTTSRKIRLHSTLSEYV